MIERFPLAKGKEAFVHMIGGKARFCVVPTA
jgi:hypothetical protein